MNLMQCLQKYLYKIERELSLSIWRKRNMIQNTDIYRCYSVNLMQFLSRNDVRYILIAKDIKSDRQFWAYVKTDKFNDLLQQWIENNPKK